MVDDSVEADRFCIPVIEFADGVFVLEHIQRLGDGEVRCAASLDIVRAVHTRVRLPEGALPEFGKLIRVTRIDTVYMICHVSI